MFSNIKNNKKGSTLVIVVMVFAVLMIFGTFLLSFTVTETKQAMYYQNKTQAYYIAKSGADIVEDALISSLNDTKSISHYNSLLDYYKAPKEVIIENIDGFINPVIIVVEEIEGQNVLTITTTAEHANIRQNVKKVLYSEYNKTTKTEMVIGGDELFVFLSDADDAIAEIFKSSNGKEWDKVDFVDGKYAKKGEANEYPIQELPIVETEVWNLQEDTHPWYVSPGVYRTDSSTYGEIGKDTDIYINGSLELSGNPKFTGNVNIYIKNNVVVNSNIKIIGDKTLIDDTYYDYNLTLFIYNEDNADYSLKTSGPANTMKDITIVGNIYINNGDVKIEFKDNFLLDGNLLHSGEGDEIRWSSDDNGNKERMITGSIYAPRSIVSLGVDGFKLNQTIGGKIIAEKIKIFPNGNGKTLEFIDNSGSSSVVIPVTDATDIISESNLSYGSYYIDMN